MSTADNQVSDLILGTDERG